MVPQAKNLVSVGAITGAHGVKGEVKLRSFTSDPAAIAGYGALQSKAGAVIEIVKLRPETNGFIATLKGVTDRDRAQALKGTELFVPRERLPETEGDEIYLGDLVGLAVWHENAKLGEVVSIQNYGAGDLIDVKIGKDTVLIPLSFANVSAGKIVVDLPDGYLDDVER